jgi:hypothetical protein
VDLAVVAAGRQPATVGREGDRAQLVGQVEGDQLAARGAVPDQQRLVVGHRGDQRAVGGEGGPVDGAQVALEAALLGPGGEVAQDQHLLLGDVGAAAPAQRPDPTAGALELAGQHHEGAARGAGGQTQQVAVLS